VQEVTIRENKSAPNLREDSMMFIAFRSAEPNSSKAGITSFLRRNAIDVPGPGQKEFN
jgi:hypothetical protein